MSFSVLVPLICFLIVTVGFFKTACSTSLFINTTRVLAEIQELAAHNDLTPPSVQRIIYTPSDMSARKYLLGLFASANLSVQIDAVGNQFAVWHGSKDMRSGAIATGSHIDAIPHSGMYDGVLGVLGALEAVRALQLSGFKPARDVHIIAFTSEEPTRFGIGCLGSRLMSGSLTATDVATLTDQEGITLDTARTRAGFDGNMADVELSEDAYSAFVELHIEQADSLEEAKIDIGAVTAIAAPAQAEVRFRGKGGHAGALPMVERNDASLAAAALSLEVERASLDANSTYAVGTTGKFQVFPGAVNSVPRVAELGIDIRDIDLKRRNAALTRVQEAAREIADSRGVEVEFNITNADAPAKCAEHIIKGIEQAASQSGLSIVRLVSRAYHDALFMARKFPTGMIFVPCKGGVSHRPDEYVEPQDIENGVLTLARTIATLSSETTTAAHDEL